MLAGRRQAQFVLCQDERAEHACPTVAALLAQQALTGCRLLTLTQAHAVDCLTVPTPNVVCAYTRIDQGVVLQSTSASLDVSDLLCVLGL